MNKGVKEIRPQATDLCKEKKENLNCDKKVRGGHSVSVIVAIVSIPVLVD